MYRYPWVVVVLVAASGLEDGGVLLQVSNLDETAKMDLVLLPESSYGDGGRCLDGSMAGYYYGAPPAGESDLWVISMDGGGACTDQQSCASRANTQKGSSKQWHQTRESNDVGSDRGILSPFASHNPDFYNAHKVSVPYCTGDTHAGTVVNPTTEQWGFYFSGHLNFKFIVEHIAATIPAGAKAKRVLLTGNSAGGAGTIWNCDFLQDKLVSLGLRATLKCAPLAGWFFPGFTEDQSDVELPPSAYSAWSSGGSGGLPLEAINGLYQSYVHPDCMKAHGASDAWKCGTASAVYPYIKTPMYVMEHQYDVNQVVLQLGLPKSSFSTVSGEEFIAYFGRAMRNSTQQVLAKPGNGLFHPSCMSHGDGLGISGTTQVKGHTSAKGLGDWFFGRNGTPAHLVDDCDMPEPGLPCNPTC